MYSQYNRLSPLCNTLDSTKTQPTPYNGVDPSPARRHLDQSLPILRRLLGHLDHLLSYPPPPCTCAWPAMACSLSNMAKAILPVFQRYQADANTRPVSALVGL